MSKQIVSTEETSMQEFVAYDSNWQDFPGLQLNFSIAEEVSAIITYSLNWSGDYYSSARMHSRLMINDIEEIHARSTCKDGRLGLSCTCIKNLPAGDYTIRLQLRCQGINQYHIENYPDAQEPHPYAGKHHVRKLQLLLLGDQSQPGAVQGFQLLE